MAALITHARAVLLALVLAAPAALADDTVIVGTSSMVSTIDPTPGSNGWSLTSHGISENLFTVDKDGAIVGVIAESATKVSDMVWDVTLKAGYTFSDGTAVTAARVAAALTELMMFQMSCSVSSPSLMLLATRH